MSNRRRLSLRSVGPAGWFAVLFWVATPVAAQRTESPEPDAVVILPDCHDAQFGLPLRRIMLLELTDSGLTRVEIHVQDGIAPRSRVRLSVLAACDEPGVVELDVRGGEGEPGVHQRLDLTEVTADTRPRAIAVAAAETVRLQRLLAAEQSAAVSVRSEAPTLRSVLHADPPAAPPPAPIEDPERPTRPVAAVPVRTTRPEPALRGALQLGAELRGFPEYGTWPAGARVGAQLSVVQWLRIGFDAGAAFASTDVVAGRVETWLFSVAFAAGVGFALTDVLGLTLAARFDVGYASFSGIGRGGTTRRGEGPWLACLGTLRFDVGLGPRVGLYFDVELGGTVVGHVALAGTEVVAGASGFLLGTRAGFAFGL